MKQTKRFIFTSLTLAALTAGAWAQTQVASNNDGPVKPTAAATAAASTPAAPPVITAADVQALKDAIAAQQKQIQALQDQLNRQAQQVQLTNDAIVKPVVKTDTPQPTQQIALAGDSSSSSSSSAAIGIPAEAIQEPTASNTPEQMYHKDMEGPMTIHFKGINITPGGFAAAEFVRRSRALGTDVTTPFNSLTAPGASQSNLPEFFGTARQSRPTLYFAARPGNVQLSAYISADFLSAGTTSTATQTNSYTLRMRQAWGEAKFDSGWSFLGGQMWSLVTENKASIAPSDDIGRTNDVRPTTIDSSYNVGFSWARQPGVRVTKTFGSKVALAFAVENPQATVTTSGNSNDYVFVQPGASNNYNSTATYGFNPSPDLVAKIAFDPGFGHYEIFGLADRFTDRILPCENIAFAGTPAVLVAALPACTAASTLTAGSTADAYNSTKSGGGFGANARWNFFNKHIVFGLHGFGGSGIGRYGSAQLPDASINADGSVHLIKDLQGLATLEWKSKKLDVYTYVGSEYAARTFSYDPVQSSISATPVFVGYGAPSFNNSGCFTEAAPTTGTLTGSTVVPGSLSKCSSQARDITEGTVGFWYRFFSGPRGRVQWGAQYSYVNRNVWSANGGLPAGRTNGFSPNGLDNMIFTSFRYYLP